MKTEDVLNIDCTIEKERNKLNKFLWKVKPVAKLLDKNSYTTTEIAPIELLEQTLTGICERYNYRTQGIDTYYEHDKFVFYMSSVINKNNNTSTWTGNVYGKTLWEVVAKLIVKIYSDILKERKTE